MASSSSVRLASMLPMSFRTSTGSVLFSSLCSGKGFGLMSVFLGRLASPMPDLP